MTPAQRYAARLRELRELVGLSQRALAASAGVPLSRVRDLEQGIRRPPPLDVAEALCRALGCGVADLAAPPSRPFAARPRGRPRPEKD
jgi:transcriptional regulator with XRE-family HTH domain